MATVIHFKIREYFAEHLRPDGRWDVLTMMLSHCNMRMRCWPSLDLLVDESGHCREAVNNAKNWLVDHGAIALVPYNKRVGDEINLPVRQNVYQITGKIHLDNDKIVPYLYMSPEAESEILAVLAESSAGERSLGESSAGGRKDNTIIQDNITLQDSSSALRTDEDLSDPNDPGDSDVYAELSGQTKNSIQTKIPTASRSLPNPTVVQPGFKNVPIAKAKPELKRDTPPTDLERYLLKHLANVAPNQWVRETSRLSAENRVKLSTAVTDSMSPEWLWDHDPRFKEWVQERGHYFIAKATKKSQNTLVNLVCKYDTEEYGWYAWCDKHPKPITLSPAETLKVELDNWVRAYYDPRKENGMLNVEDEQIHDRMVKAYQDALGNQVE